VSDESLQPQQASKVGTFFRRRPGPDKHALENALLVDPPEHFLSAPATVTLGLTELVLSVVFHVVLLFGLAFAYIYVFQDWKFIVLSLLGVTLSVLASQFPDFPARYRSATASTEGLRLVRNLRSDILLNWWDLRALTASQELNFIRLEFSSRTVTLPLRRAVEQQRLIFLQTVRAHAAPYDVQATAWKKSNTTVRSIVPVVAQVGAVGTIIAAGILAAPGTLGLRCSSNGAYFQRTFGTPAQAGCVVLRVSAGADKAGIKRGDLMIEMNGVPVTSGIQYQRLFDDSNGRSWTFKVIRTGVSEPLEFTVHPAPSWNFSKGPQDAITYYLDARWERDEDPGAAIDDYSQAIALQPDFDLAYLYRGQIYEDRNRLDDAKSDYERAISLSPNLGEAQAIYANFLYVYDESTGEAHISKALQLDSCEERQPLNVDCAYDYGIAALYAQDTSPDTAINYTDRAEEFDPTSPFPYFVEACAYSRKFDQDHFKQAADKFFEVADLDLYAEHAALLDKVLSGDTPFC
jgi:hypothetical protein